MFKYLVNTCITCENVKETLTLLDEKISQVTTNAYQNLVFQVTKPFEISKLNRLIFYKKMLTNLFFNKSYYYPYNYKDIVSKAKTLL